MASSSVTVKFGEQEMSFELYEGSLDLGSVQDTFNLTSVAIDGRVVGKDASGLSRNKFEPGSVVKVTGVTKGAGSGAGGGPADAGSMAAQEGAGDLLDTVYLDRLPSASQIAGSNKFFTSFLEQVPIIITGRRRQGQERALQGTPITAAAKPFAEFSFRFAAASGPTHEACRLAQALCNILCVVWMDEVQQLQASLQQFVCQLVSGLGLNVSPGQRGTSNPDIQVMHADLVPLLLVECKLDSGGNTLGQALHYYLQKLLQLHRSRTSQWLNMAMHVPVFILEISGNRVRISAAIWQQDVILAESLLDVTCSHDESSMTTLARGITGLQHSLRTLVASYTSPTRGVIASQHAPFPQFLVEQFPGYTFARAFKSPRMWRIMPSCGTGSTASSSSSCTETVVKLVRARAGDPALQAHSLLAAIQCAPPMLSDPHRVSQEWWAIHMPLYRWQDGWWPLDVLHPGSNWRNQDSRFPVLNEAQWVQLCEAARAALHQLHQVQLLILGEPGLQGPLVWGDARLANMLAQYNTTLGAWHVLVIDLDFAGVQGVSKYPSTMNTELWWPDGAGPAQLMHQVHDTQLLERQLRPGSLNMNAASDTDARRAGGDGIVSALFL